MLDKKCDINYHTDSYTIKDYYKSYMRLVESDGYVTVSYQEFRGVLEDYFKALSEAIIFDGKTVVLPGRMGELSVRKYVGNPNYLMYDYKTSKELGASVWHFNDHSGGYRYKFYWNKKKMLTSNSKKYQLLLTRNNKRTLAAVIKNKTRDYIGI